MSHTEERARFLRESKATNKVRRTSRIVITDPCSRHAAMIADHVGRRKPYPMLQEEPEHCAESIIVTVRELWLARLRIDELEAQLAMLGHNTPLIEWTAP